MYNGHQDTDALLGVALALSVSLQLIYHYCWRSYCVPGYSANTSVLLLTIPRKYSVLFYGCQNSVCLPVVFNQYNIIKTNLSHVYARCHYMRKFMYFKGEVFLFIV